MFKREGEQTIPGELDFGSYPCCLGKLHSFITLSIKIKRTLETFDGCFYSLELKIDSGMVQSLRVASIIIGPRELCVRASPCLLGVLFYS